MSAPASRELGRELQRREQLAAEALDLLLRRSAFTQGARDVGPVVGDKAELPTILAAANGCGCGTRDGDERCDQGGVHGFVIGTERPCLTYTFVQYVAGRTFSSAGDLRLRGEDPAGPQRGDDQPGENARGSEKLQRRGRLVEEQGC